MFRRTALVAAWGVLATPWRALAAMVGNVTGLYGVDVARIEVPGSAAAIGALLRSWPGPVAVGGGRYSMGGQVGIAGGLHLDMRTMNRLVWLRAADKVVRVQAGMRWRDLQELIDPLGLAVKTMQSYANFTVGGSVSVNAHGRYVGHGPVGHTVRALQLVLADGEVVEASATQRPELFSAAIGGYGAVGVITEVELELADNLRIERRTTEVALGDYLAFFDRRVLADSSAVLHNADLMPPLFDRPVAVTWRRSEKPLTESARLVAREQRYALEQNVLWAMTELPGGARLRRSVIHPLVDSKPSVKWLNHEASRDVAELEPRQRDVSTYVLQEYFVPRRHFVSFAQGLARSLRQTRAAEAVNVSIRHSPVDRVSLLPWAREEVFCFVLFYKQRTGVASREAVGRWTRELIDLALQHEGRYYLPYQLHATQEQFDRAYPEAAALRAVKTRVDPQGRFSNQLWARYMPS